MGRITAADLEAMAKAIDSALGLPEGTHFISGAYGGKALQRDGGAITVEGYDSSGGLMAWMRAYKSGIYAGRKAEAETPSS